MFVLYNSHNSFIIIIIVFSICLNKCILCFAIYTQTELTSCNSKSNYIVAKIMKYLCSNCVMFELNCLHLCILDFCIVQYFFWSNYCLNCSSFYDFSIYVENPILILSLLFILFSSVNKILF